MLAPIAARAVYPIAAKNSKTICSLGTATSDPRGDKANTDVPVPSGTALPQAIEAAF